MRKNGRWSVDRHEQKSMNRLWSALEPTQANGANPLRSFFLGQFIAVVAAVAALAVHRVAGPAFSHSVYLFCLPALLICAALGGFPSGMSATVILAMGAFLADAAGGLPPPERIGRALLFILLGAVVATVAGWLRRAFGRTRRHAIRMEEREAILRAMLDAVTDGAVVIDEEAVVVGFSQAAERLFGWSAKEIQGKNVSLLMPAEQAAAHDAEVRRYVETGERRVIGSSRQVTGRRKDGAEFPMELRLAEVRIGRRRYFTGVVRDLSTMREAERRSDELQAHLTQVWSLNSMGEMASVLAHELNQPLSAVANYLRAARTLIAQLEVDDDNLLDAVSRAGDQAVRAGEIIRTMRDLATRGGTEQKPESLSAILGEIDFIVGLMVRDAGSPGILRPVPGTGLSARRQNSNPAARG